ncbi:bifunctional ADP-dependent NAD(P)H-hydrate dehydratase/NAD(P)H-hydrate epimerase [Maridesulfovibrio frigidus]|uniref:bifunctional ADP-dependent NAD(P)H-hydrate dehydratase/NAD(P)H-hydrate epimerase n=1 Tax=Maridesulfovibrio frigidus TaxID=340956 RepID=UPI0004E10336|nr:bifunctional ADP-dependent NAD(P)H-hydrate dehydratase/NAD(P)H-hydrate epimerase [Maridesulfovibrio frigidus]
MFSPLPTPLQMNGWDRAAINEIGIRGEILMENAAREAVATLLSEFGPVESKKILIIAGSGNNGGDGFVMGRQLADLGADVLIMHTAPKNKYKGDALYHLKVAVKAGVQLKFFRAADKVSLPKSDIIIDALLGTGFDNELRPFAQLIVEAINLKKDESYIFSVDVPSGLNGLTGKVHTIAVKAHATVTFEAAKVGLVLPESKAYTGKLIVRPIGIPDYVKKAHPVDHFLMNNKIFEIIPALTPGMHKGTSGHVLIIGGAPGMTGALELAGLAAIRSGAGLVTLGCPSGLASEVSAFMPELMTMALGSGDHWDDQAIKDLLPVLKDYDALAIGPGLGRTEGAMNLVEAIVLADHPPAIFDADALYALSKRTHLLPLVKEDTIFTPHPGEMGRLVNKSIPEIESARIETAHKYAVSKKVVMVLKGAGTIVGCPDGKTMISPICAPNLAAAGSGDILAGIIGALLAKGIHAMQSACMGVYLHGKCGLYLNKKFPHRGNIATEIANSIPEVLKEELC